MKSVDDICVGVIFKFTLLSMRLNKRGSTIFISCFWRRKFWTYVINIYYVFICFLIVGLEIERLVCFYKLFSNYNWKYYWYILKFIMQIFLIKNLTKVWVKTRNFVSDISEVLKKYIIYFVFSQMIF